MAEIGYASLGIIPTFDKFGSQLESGTGKYMSSAGSSGGAKFGASAAESARGKLSSLAKSVVAPLAGAFAAVKVKDFLVDAVKGASDLNETTNKVQQVFGKASGDIFKFSSKAAKAIGQTNQQARDAASTFGIFGKVAKLTDKQNAKFSVRMTKLASDLASFHNTSPEQAIEAIGAAMRGESEPIRAYGVLLDEATLKAEAMRIGLLKPVKDKAKIEQLQVSLIEKQKAYNEAVKENGKNSFDAQKAQAALGYTQGQLQKATAGTIPQLTQQQKVLAAQSAILQQTKVAQGDFARTSGGLANQQRILTARWEDAKTQLGTALLPTVNKAVKFLNDKGIPAFEKFADWFGKKGVPAIARFSRKAEPFVHGVLTDARDILKDAEPYAKGFVKAFNSLPDGVKKGLGSAALLGLGAKKLGLIGGGKGGGGPLSLGGKSLFGKAVEMALPKKPVPVFVVNQGDGLGGYKGYKGALAKWGPAGAVAATTAAVGVGTVDQMDSLSRHNAARSARPGSLDELKNTLQNSQLGKYADELHVNVDRFATDLYNVGTKGKYASKVIAEMNGKAHGFGAFVGGLAGTVVPGWTSSTEKTVGAQEDLAAILKNNQKLFGRGAAAILRYQANAAVLNSGLEALSRNLDKLDGRKVRIRITTAYAAAGYQTKGGLQARAGGGPVAAHRPYLVGEREPELFVPNTPGRILNQRQMAAAGVAGGGRSVTIQVGEVRAHNYDDFMRQMQQRSVHAGGGGVTF